jgi:hypothetical protein
MGIDLLCKTVVLKKKGFLPEYQDEKFRTVKVLAGFGASAETRGTALHVEFLSGGEKARYDGYDVEKVLEDGKEPKIEARFADGTSKTLKIPDFVKSLQVNAASPDITPTDAYDRMLDGDTVAGYQVFYRMKARKGC